MEGAERSIDELQLQMRDYLVALSQRKLTLEQARELPELLHCVNDAERISDLALKIYRKTDRIAEAGLSVELTEGANALVSRMRAFAQNTIAAIRGESPSQGDLKAEERKINEEARRLAKGCNRDLAFQTVLYGVRDITRHLGNIAERSYL